MYDQRAWAALLEEILRDLRHALQREVERFTFELENWINWLVTRPLPANWRKQTADFLAHWETEGYALSPYSKGVLDWWIEAWARRRGFWPQEDGDVTSKMPQRSTAVVPTSGRPQRKAQSSNLARD